MSVNTRKLSSRLPNVMGACMLASLSLLAGCDKSAQDNTVADTTTNPNDTVTTNNSATNTSSVDTVEASTTTDVSTGVITDMPIDDKVVSPNGYRGLKFGQAVTPELMDKLGLVTPNFAVENESCYFTYFKDMATAESKKDMPVASVIYQIVDGKLALIQVTDDTVPFYTGAKIGDAPAKVLAEHNNNLYYEVDKYSQNGDIYNLIHNVNFTINDGVSLEDYLSSGAVKDIKLDNKYGETPLQIKYRFDGGADMGAVTLAPTDWDNDIQSKLTGKLTRIEIGTTEAISLVEGCS